MSGNFIWYELLTDDMDGAAAFYSHVVGWTVQRSTTPGLDYREWCAQGAHVGGLMAIPPGAAAGGMRPGWLGYVDVPDVDKAVAGIQAAGGAVPMPATNLEGVGRFALATDPQGAAFYVMTSAGEGQGTAYAPGQPGHGGWHELHSTGWEAAFDFYQAQLGWGRSDVMDMGPMGKYLLFNNGGDAIGGMLTAAQVRPGWLFYFCIDEIDAARARVEEAGGQVTNGPHQVPGGGWIIQAVDPQGGKFALTGPRTAG